MLRNRILVVLTVSAVLWSAAAQAQTPAGAKSKPARATAPARTTAPARSTQPGAARVKVVSVSGKASKLLPGPKAKWTAVKAGQMLDERTIIRTGFGAGVVLRFADSAEVTVGSVTKMGIGEFRTPANESRIRLGLKYGTLRANVDTARRRSDYSVRTSVATLSVRGTIKFMSFFPDTGARGLGIEGFFAMASGGGTQTGGPGQGLTEQQRMALYRLLYMYSGLYGPVYGLSPSEFAMYLLLAGGGRGGTSGFPPTNTGLGGIGGPLPYGPLLTTTPGPINPGYP